MQRAKWVHIIYCAFLISTPSAVFGSRVTVDIQLSPDIVVGSITRCICFRLFDCFQYPIEQCLEITFIDGVAQGITFDVEFRDYECIEARDPLHTLRSLSEAVCVGSRCSAGFIGDPESDGNWLINGNLNDDFVIDIRDIAVYKSEILSGASYPNGDTTCTTQSPHGDINGDGSVDILDHDIIAFVHFISEQKAGCWKTVCDCLNPELDSDGDNVPDCVDLCPDIDDTIFAPQCVDAVPTISEWGVLVLALLLLITGKIYFGMGRLYRPAL